MVIWIWLAVALSALAMYMWRVYSTFRDKGVKYEMPLPLFGNMASVLFRTEHFIGNLVRTYKLFPTERFYGKYEFFSPVVVLRDLELVKKVTVKDFDHFLDHRRAFNDQVFGRTLFALRGQEWKDMRSTLSPAFTSSKIRAMVPFMVEVGDQMISSLKKQIEESGNDFVDVDCKDLTTRYANDVIASCAFGLKVDSHSERENQFYLMGKKATTLTFRRLIVILVGRAFPKVGKKLNWSLFPEDSQKFFKDLVLDTMADREIKNIIRPDMIHLLLEAKKGRLTHDDKVSKDVDAGFATVKESSVGKKKIIRGKGVDVNWTENDLVAQALIFFLAGFETVSSVMSFLLCELAANPEVQERLAQEVRDTDAKNDGKFDFNSIQQMTYMDMVVSEVLRRWPSVAGTDRTCVKDYNLGKPNDGATQDYIIHAGEDLFIPVWAFHYDPQYFPDPYKFDPERFSDENKHQINHFSYMPFGLGPRNCIGSRFALCEVKVIAYQILRHIELSPGPQMEVPLEMDLKNFQAKPKGGFVVRMRARE